MSLNNNFSLDLCNILVMGQRFASRFPETLLSKGLPSLNKSNKEINMNLTKICSNPNCKQEKILSEFGKNKHAKDGFTFYCKLCIKERGSLYYIDNAIKIRKKHKKYKNENKEKINKYHREKKRKDSQFKIICNLRTRLNGILKSKNINKTFQSHIKFLGCSAKQLKEYLENQFKENMSWNNHGLYGWHIDHIKPLSSFDLTIEEQVKQACHYTNLQPLWAEENLSKGDKTL